MCHPLYGNMPLPFCFTANRTLSVLALHEYHGTLQWSSCGMEWGSTNTLDGMSFKLYLKCVALFPGLPRFCSSVCIQNNIHKRKSGEKQGRPVNTYHMTWTRGRRKATNLCTVNVREIEMVSGNNMHRLEGITRRRLRGSSLEEKAIASSSLVVKV